MHKGHTADSLHGDAHGLFSYRNRTVRKLKWSLGITLTVMGVELAGGILTRSIALISDAGHMFTHSFAIIIGLIAIYIARKPQCHHRTFGLYRAEVLAAFTNGLFLLAVAGIIITEAIKRFMHPVAVLGTEMLAIALIGFVTNLVSIAILHGGRSDLNVRGVFMHLIADAASSVGILAAALIIIQTGWYWLDPLVSVAISMLIVIWAWGVLKESGIILLEMAPRGLDSETVSQTLLDAVPEIVSVETPHLWSITPEMRVFSAHVILSRMPSTGEWDGLMQRAESALKERYRLIEITLQPGVKRQNGGKGSIH